MSNSRPHHRRWLLTIPMLFLMGCPLNVNLNMGGPPVSDDGLNPDSPAVGDDDNSRDGYVLQSELPGYPYMPADVRAWFEHSATICYSPAGEALPSGDCDLPNKRRRAPGSEELWKWLAAQSDFAARYVQIKEAVAPVAP